MSTLELEHLKHSSSSGNNLSVHSDGSLTLGMLQGNVGIGTASPTVKLEAAGDIKASVSGTNAQISAITDGASNYATFTATNGSRSYSMQIRPDQSNAFTIRDETGGGNRLLVDTGGAVRMPSQPAFHVRLNDAGAQVQLPHTTHTVWENQGGHWNSSTHRFVAPVGGFYWFIFHGYTNYTSGHGYIGVRKNGTQIQNGWHWNYTTTHHGTTGITAGITLQTNDYVDFTRPSAGASSRFDIINVSGFLIG